VRGYRLGASDLTLGLDCIAGVVTRLRTELHRPVLVFVASDTEEGLLRARALLGTNGTRVASTSGRAVHTKARGTFSAAAAAKVAADLLSFAMADVHFALGQSSLSSNAAQLGFATIRRTGWDSVCRKVEPAEIESLRRTIEESG
jgi:hypothetical protein